MSRLKPARYGVRFTDVARAARNAVLKIEMAVLSTDHSLPRLDIDYRDCDGFKATLQVTFDPRGPLANVEYAVFSGQAQLPRR